MKKELYVETIQKVDNGWIVKSVFSLDDEEFEKVNQVIDGLGLIKTEIKTK